MIWFGLGWFALVAVLLVLDRLCQPPPDCPTCHGTGKQHVEVDCTCTDCGGNGRTKPRHG